MHGERRRQQVELAHALARGTDVGRDLVAIPELRLEIGDELVVDHELRFRERRQPLEHLGRVVRDLVGAALHGREPDTLSGDMEDDDVRERPNQVRIARAEHVLRYLIELVEGSRIGASRGTAERLGIGGVEHVEDEVRLGVVVDQFEVVMRELLCDRPNPCLVRRRRRRSPDGELPHAWSLPRTIGRDRAPGASRDRRRARLLRLRPP